VTRKSWNANRNQYRELSPKKKWKN